jgi:hypothetical protein
MRLSPETAWEQISALASVEDDEPFADSSTGLVGNLELHRPASLLLNDGRAIANSPASKHVIDPQPERTHRPGSGGTTGRPILPVVGRLSLTRAHARALEGKFEKHQIPNRARASSIEMERCQHGSKKIGRIGSNGS